MMLLPGVCVFQLAPDDAWRCPHCKQLQQGRIKLNLWTLPDVLILHLKRFRQVLHPDTAPVSFECFPCLGPPCLLDSSGLRLVWG